MDIALMFDSWGLSDNIPALLDITANHKTSLTSLRRLDRILVKAYHPDEIPNVVAMFSPILNDSIVGFLRSVGGGADYIIDILESDY